MKAINPTTGEPIRDYPEHDDDEVERRLRRAEQAFADWRRRPITERAALMRRAAQLLRQDRAEHARLMTEEMGKPIAAAEAEIEKCASACDYYAEHAGSLLASRDVATDASHSFVRYDPLGCVLAVMPWNFPFWQVFRFAAPTLMAAMRRCSSTRPTCPAVPWRSRTSSAVRASPRA